MNILLVGERYSANLGDAVICETVERIVKEQYEDANIVSVDLSGRVSYGTYYDVVRDLRQLNLSNYLSIPFKYKDCLSIRYCLTHLSLRDVLRYTRMLVMLERTLKEHKFDLILFAGGQLFYDYFIDMLHCIVERCSRECSNIVFHACGLGEINKRSEQLLKEIFMNPSVKSVSIRDSKKKFDGLFKEIIDVEDTFDTALCCCNYYQKSELIVAEYGIGCLGSEGKLNEHVSLVKNVMQTGRSWKLFTNGNQNDEIMARKILLELGMENQEDNLILKRPVTASELIKNITSFKYIISYRMHSQIVAASYGIPFCGIAWDKKIIELFEKLGIQERCYMTGTISHTTKFFCDNIQHEELCQRVVYQASMSKRNLIEQLNRIV